MSIGERIKLKRLENNYTLEQLANAVNTSKQTIHRYETGIISNIPASKIQAIAEALNTTPAYLMCWEEPTDNAEQQTDDELDKEIIEGYSRLDDDGKKIVSDLINSILKNRSDNNTTDNK